MAEFKLKDLQTENGRREYYRVDLSNPMTVRNGLVEPYLDPSYNAELAERYGYDELGDQRVRIAWAAELRQVQYKDEGWRTVEYLGRKYPHGGGFRIKIDDGYIYQSDKGKQVHVKRVEDVPPGKPAVKTFYYDDLGTRKFVVEMKFTLQEMVQLGWCPPPDTPRGEQWCVRGGKRYRSAPDPGGEYVLLYYIEDEAGEYRDVRQEDIDFIHSVINRAQTETEAERVTRRMAERDKIQKALAAEEKQKEAAAWGDALIRVQKRPRGVKIFS